MFMPQVRERFVGGGIEMFSEKKADAIQLVHAVWCGHCKTLLQKNGEWDQLTSSMPGVSFSVLDESSIEGKAAIKNGDIKGFPDIRSVKNTSKGAETVQTYEGPRKASDMKKWISSQL